MILLQQLPAGPGLTDYRKQIATAYADASQYKRALQMADSLLTDNRASELFMN